MTSDKGGTYVLFLLFVCLFDVKMHRLTFKEQGQGTWSKENLSN